MQLSEMRTEIRDITSTDSTSFSDTDLDRKLNIEYKSIIAEIMEATGHINSFVLQKYTDLVKADGLSARDIGYNGEYPFPDGCLAINRIEVKYDEDSRPLTIYSQSQNNITEFITEDIKSVGGDRMRFIRDSVLVRPLPEKNVTDGFFMEYLGIPADLSDDTDVADFSSLFHDVLVLATADRYYLKYPEKYNPKIEQTYIEKREKMKDFFNDRFPKYLNVNGKQENFN